MTSIYVYWKQIAESCATSFVALKYSSFNNNNHIKFMHCVLLHTSSSTATNFKISCCKTVDQVIIGYMDLPECMLCLLPF